MQLPPELLAEFANQQTRQIRSGPERRRGRRYACGAQTVVCRRSRQPQSMQVTVRDIAAGGISLQCEQPLRVGERFTIVLPRASAAPVAIECVSTRWFPLGDHAFLVGASFEQIVGKPAGQSPAMAGK